MLKFVYTQIWKSGLISQSCSFTVALRRTICYPDPVVCNVPLPVQPFAQNEAFIIHVDNKYVINIHALGQSCLDQKITVSLFCRTELALCQAKHMHVYFAVWCILKAAVLTVYFWVPKLMGPSKHESHKQKDCS